MMKRLLDADLFALKKSKILLVLFIIAAGTGFLLPAMYYGILKLLDWTVAVTTEAGVDIEGSVEGLGSLMNMLNGKMVFLSVLPLSQGFGIVLPALLGLHNARPFGSGVLRNKIIGGFSRTGIYLSQLAVSFLLSIPAFLIYTGSAALATLATFGEIGLTGSEWVSLLLLSLGIYTVYTAIPVFAAFLTKSVPLTLLFCIMLPLFASFVATFLQPALMSAPEFVRDLVMILPSYQSIVLTVGAEDWMLFAIALGADVVLALLFTGLGLLRFRRTDLN